MGYILTPEGEDFLLNGSYVYRFLKNIQTIDLKNMSKTEKLGFERSMKNKLVKMDKGVIVKLVEDYTVDIEVEELKEILLSDEQKDEYKDYVKRKLVVFHKDYVPVKPLENKQKATFDSDMIKNGSWKDIEFKPLNLNAAGRLPITGSLRLLPNIKRALSRIMLNHGYSEMGGNWVDNSFWTFDSLFIGQQHPSRVAQDTFFVDVTANKDMIPRDYIDNVKRVHEGSLKYDWSEEEAMKGILRTHTTSCTMRELHKLAGEYKKTGIFKPAAMFSIERVFRNEDLDATHLCEFSQIEAFMIDKDLSLADLIGMIIQFLTAIGMPIVKFKPTFNPYTEPSLEFHAKHETLNKMVELGNSGMIRPEVLGPLGFPEDVRVAAFGLGLERITMLKYGVKDIRHISGHKAPISRTDPFVVFV